MLISETSEDRARTRALARVIGPFVAIVAAFLAAGRPPASALLSAYFANVALVWITSALLLLLGLLIIVHHHIWSNPAAVVISLFGWLLALRGVLLMAVPDWFERAAAAVVGAGWIVPIAAIILVVVGLWLTFVGWISEPSSPT